MNDYIYDPLYDPSTDDPAPTCPNPNCHGGMVLDPQSGTEHPCLSCEGGDR